jgi:signal transduction histidine kinase
MLSDIAHDLRTPITTIAGYAKALNDGMVTSEEKKREYLEAIENKSERMNNLINLLYEYVKLDSDNFTLKKEKVDLAELLRENAALLYQDVEEKGMELVVDIPENPCEVEIDPLQISRVITNLINNSIRHNESGTTITLELKDVFYNREIVISDDGEPIDESVVDNIFEPFAVGDTSRRTKGGSGLGLSIAKRIVEMHGWEIDLYQNKRGYKKAFIINVK